MESNDLSKLLGDQLGISGDQLGDQLSALEIQGGVWYSTRTIPGQWEWAWVYQTGP